MTIEDAISQGIECLNIQPASQAVPRLAAFVALLERWNRAYNLTAVRQPREMVPRHILDSLAILPWLQGPRVLDVGSGAGLPGIPLAIASPDSRFWLLDSNGKRVRFMRQASLELGLDNVQVVQGRVEDYTPDEPFASIVSRAFASLAAMLQAVDGLCALDGRLLAMKGERPERELMALPAGFQLVDIYSLTVPGLDAERHLVHLVPAADPELKAGP